MITAQSETDRTIRTNILHYKLLSNEAPTPVIAKEDDIYTDNQSQAEPNNINIPDQNTNQQNRKQYTKRDRRSVHQLLKY